jgi:glutathione S-transferase
MTAFPFTTLTTVIAICLYFYMGLRAGLGRAKYNVIAPATSGNEDWERLYRVQMNTLEGMPIFLPLLWLFSSYHSDLLGALIGLVWVAGRAIFMVGYTKSAQARSTGFQIQMAGVAILLIGTIIGIAKVLITQS